VLYCLFCVVLCIVCEYICVLNYCHRVATQLQLNISYHNISYHIISIQPKHVAVIIYKIRCFDGLFIGCIKTKTVTLSNNIIYKHFTIWILFLYTGHWIVCCVCHTAVVSTHTRNLRKRMGKEILDHGWCMETWTVLVTSNLVVSLENTVSTSV